MAHQNKRDAVKGAYPSKKWHNRVNGMSDEQVTAVYLRLKQQNVL
jgi:hypothetical protein